MKKVLASLVILLLSGVGIRSALAVSNTESYLNTGEDASAVSTQARETTDYPVISNDEDLSTLAPLTTEDSDLTIMDRRTRPGRDHRDHSRDRDRYRGHHDRPGWESRWHWNRDWRPRWADRGIRFPRFIRHTRVPIGYYQCTAFDRNMNAYSASGLSVDQAAYNALYDCGGSDFQMYGCYIPNGYCNQ